MRTKMPEAKPGPAPAARVIPPGKGKRPNRAGGPPAGQPMVRTQIYLSPAEYDFVRAEANRRMAPMASVIRSYIDEKMTLPEEVWANNPLLRPPVHDPTYVPRGDASINHDHYLYGGPKKYQKRKGKWVTLPPLA